MRLLLALVRGLLRLGPARFRDRFGASLLETVEDGWRAARRRGRLAAWGFAGRTVADLPPQLAGAWMERFRRTTGGGTMAGRWDMDLRHAARALARRPGTTAVAVAILGIGVGAAATVYAVVDGVLLSPMDMPGDDRLVLAQDRQASGGDAPFATTGGVYLTWRRESRTLEGVAAMMGWTMNLTEPGLEPFRLRSGLVSANFFDVLGVEPIVGRTFRPEEEQGLHRVMVLSHALWTGRYGADPDVVGSVVDADGEAWEIIGVMPPLALPGRGNSAALVDGSRVRTAWVPMNLEESWQSGFRSHLVLALGRLAPGATVEQARDELAVLTDAVRREHPENYTGLTAHVTSLREAIVGDVRGDLLVLLGGVLLVVLAGCINLGNLLLVRSMDRSRERAVRRALGAGRGSLVRLAAAESLLLGLGGAVVAAGVLVLGVQALGAALPADLPRRAAVSLRPGVLVLTPLVALALGLAVGLLPTLGRSVGDPVGPGSGTRTTRGRREQRTSRVLVAGQVALACTLLVGSGLLLRSVRSLASVDLGVSTDRTLVVDVLLPQGRYGDRRGTADFLRRLEEGVEGLPGALEALVAYDPPTEGTWTEQFTIVGDPEPEPGDTPGSFYRPVSPGWFETMDIPVVAGRTFTEDDDLDGPPVVVVNQAWVREHMPGREPLGARIHMETVRNNWGGDAPVEWEIVGVVGDVRFRGLRAEPGDAVYFSGRQSPTTFTRFLVRTEGDPEALLPGVQAVLGELDPRLPLAGATTLEREVRAATAQDRFNALLILAFAAAALLVASAGLYGVLAYAVARRRTEVGVRMAMGAAPLRVWRMLVLEGLALAGVGLAVGLALALLTGGLLGSVLYGVSPRDPVVLGTVVLVLGGSALLAAAVPATRAASAHPAEALQSD